MYVGMAAFRRVQRVLTNLVVAWILLAVPCAAARAATVQTDLVNMLTSAGVLNPNTAVAVTGSAGAYQVTFQGSLANAVSSWPSLS